MGGVCGVRDRYPLSGSDIDGGLRTKGQYKSGSKDRPLITYITVAYRSARTLRCCIDSILNQTYTNIEYIVIDGGSPDGTKDILCTYEKRLDYFISQPDQGIYEAMNKGLALSRGQLICFMNADDACMSNAAEIVVREYMRTGRQLICGGRQLIGEKGRIWETRYPRFNVRKPVFRYLQTFHQAFYAAPEIYERVGSYRAGEYRLLADWIWQAKAIDAGYEILYIDDELCRFHYGGASNTYAEERDREWERWICETFPYLSERDGKYFLNSLDRGRHIFYDLKKLNRRAFRYLQHSDFLNSYASAAMMACVELIYDICALGADGPADTVDSAVPADKADSDDTADMLHLDGLVRKLSTKINRIYRGEEAATAADLKALETIKHRLNRRLYRTWKETYRRKKHHTCDDILRLNLYRTSRLASHSGLLSEFYYEIIRWTWIHLFNGRKVRR